MALTANRVKTTSSLIRNIRSIIIMLRHMSVGFLIIVSLYIFIAAPKKLSAISLEIVGPIISGSLFIHENLFKQIKLLTQNTIYLRNLAKENIELQLEISKLRQSQNDIYSLQIENSELRKLLSVVEEEQYQPITAKILTISLNPFSKTALVSAGKKHGVEVDQIVTSNEGLVGRVIEASNNFSKIILVSDANSRVPITTISSKEKGIMTGDDHNGQILYLPETHLIQKGEKIITSGYGNIYPHGITVGFVDFINKEKVSVSFATDLSKIEYVNIFIPK